MARLLGSSIAREQWLLRETRTVARLLAAGLSPEEAVLEVERENLFQYRTERTLGPIARACAKRIASIGTAEAIGIFAAGSHESASQLNLYAMMLTYPLVRHFMTSEISERLCSLDYSFGQVDLNAYFSRLEIEFENFAGMSESTKAKLKQVLMRIVREAGLLDSDGHLSPVCVEQDVRAIIEERNDREALAAFRGIMG